MNFVEKVLTKYDELDESGFENVPHDEVVALLCDAVTALRNLTFSDENGIWVSPAKLKERCSDCAYLYEGENGVWMCDDWENACRYVSLNDCPINYCGIKGEEDL